MHTDLIQAIAMIELLIERWCEPPPEGALHLSALIQQILSLTAEHGGVTARETWRALCESGPFGAVSPRHLARLLRCLGAQDLLIQSPEGTLLPGAKGERILDHFSFYTIFQTPEEYQVLHRGRALGTLTFEHLLAEGMHIIFAGRRWRVVSVTPEHKRVEVEPSPGGRIPTFLGTPGGPIHDRIRTQMCDVWNDGNFPRYLDTAARKLLAEGRGHYARLGLDTGRLLESGRDTILFLCRGDVIMNTVALLLLQHKMDITRQGPALTISRANSTKTLEVLAKIVGGGPADAATLAAHARNKQIGKYDWVLDESLLDAQYASSALDTDASHRALSELVESEDSRPR